MKKKSILSIAAAALLLVGCGSIGTSGLFGGIDGAGALGNVIVSVLGINKVSEANLAGTWNYKSPGCAFTTDNLLAKAGGEVAAAKIRSELLPHYQSLGITASNTSFTFKQDRTFSGKLAGKSINGTYVYDESTGRIDLKTLLMSISGYVTMGSSGINLLFESKKILGIMQTLGALSGNTTIGAVSEISKNYNGVRIGFELSR